VKTPPAAHSGPCNNRMIKMKIPKPKPEADKITPMMLRMRKGNVVMLVSKSNWRLINFHNVYFDFPLVRS
jgi:hypothetical protein